MTRQELERFFEALQEFSLVLSNDSGKVRKVRNCVLGMFDREAAFAVGDRADLREDITVDPESGWYPIRADLKKGSRGTIRGVVLYSTGFRYYWEPDVCTSIDSYTGHLHLKKDPYQLSLQAHAFVKVE